MVNLKIENLILLVIFLFSFVTANQAQEEDKTIKVNTYLVNIPVIASDKAGRNISGLTKDNFSIIQDGVKQEIAYFADEEVPMNVAILIQTGLSGKNTLGEIKEAARDFVKTLRPQDKAMIISFDARVKMLSNFTSDQKELFKAINKARIDYNYSTEPNAQDPVYALGSYLQDAIYRLVTKDFVTLKGRKAIVVLADGDFIGGGISDQQLLNTLAESDVLVYPIIIRDKALSPEKMSVPSSLLLPNGKRTHSKKEIREWMIDYLNKRWAFINAVADVTGGSLYPEGAKDFTQVFKPINFTQVFQTIADELKKQYLIGFYPQDVEKGKQTVITVDVNPDDIVIRTKSRIRLKMSN